MPEHCCQCRRCRPTAFPPIPDDPQAPYLNANSVDIGRERYGRPAWKWWVELDGVQVCGPPQRADAWQVLEALAGEPGWLVRVHPEHPPKWGCACGRGSCQQAVYGRVVLHSADGLVDDGTGQSYEAAS